MKKEKGQKCLAEEVCSKKKQTFWDWINFLCIYLFWWTAAISFRHKILLRINQQNQPAKNTIPIIMFTPSNTKYMLQNTKPNKHQLKCEMQKKTGGDVWSEHYFLDKGEVHKEEITFQGVELICCILCIYLLWCIAVRSFKQIIKRPKTVLLFKRNWTFFWICFTQLLLHSSLLRNKRNNFSGGRIHLLFVLFSSDESFRHKAFEN